MNVLKALRNWGRRQIRLRDLDEVLEFVVNEYGELGIKIKNIDGTNSCRVGFLYKGYLLEYEDGLKDDGTPLRYRPVWKREFGECCISPLYRADEKDFLEGGEWRDLPKIPKWMQPK